MSIGTESTDKGHSCQPCKRSFLHAHALRMHCERSKAHRQAVQKNLQTSSPTEANSEYKCKLCTRFFKSQNALNDHIRDSFNHKPTSPRASITQVKDQKSGDTAIKSNNGSKTKAANEAVPPTTTTTNNHLKQQITLLNKRIRLPGVWGNWSAIPFAERDSLVDALQAECHSIQALAKQGFWTQLPSQQDLDMNMKCKNCGAMKNDLTSICRFHPAKRAFKKGMMQGRGTGAVARRAPCVKCHQTGNLGCIAIIGHDFTAADAKIAHMKTSPESKPNSRKAVVLDCEMVGVLGPNNSQISEVIRVSAVDFLTGEILFDTYVEPAERIIAWRSQFSGVTPALLKDMKQQGRTVRGWRAARELVWKHIEQNTVLMGHALHNDLAVLRMVHTNIVDSAILTRHAVGWDCQRSWALRTLTREFVDREIQRGSNGHDCLEDTFAAREVLLWCLRNQDVLEEWAVCQRGGWIDGFDGMDLNRKSDKEFDLQDYL